MNAPLKPPRCPMCGGEHITPATLFKTQNTNTGVHLVFRAGPETWSSRGHAGIAAGRARACLDCGYVMMFLADKHLAALREGMRAGFQGLGQDEDPV